MEIEHKPHMVSFAYVDAKAELFTYYFLIENGVPTLHSIDKYERNGRNGKTFKHLQIHHHLAKPNTYCGETGEFIVPEIPDDVQVFLKNYVIGFLIEELQTNKTK